IGQTLESSDDLVNLLRPLVHNHYFEKLSLLVLNDDGAIVGYKDYDGGVNQIVVNIPDALRFVGSIRDTAGGTQLVLAHNHPSDRWQPSSEDVALTKDVARSAQTLGVPLVEHVVYG